METVMLEQETEIPEVIGYKFNAFDRCDHDKGNVVGNARGVAVAEQAYHRATKDSLELFLCNHHYDQHQDALLTGGWAIESDLQGVSNLSVKHYVDASDN